MASDITQFVQNQPAIWGFDFHSNQWPLNVGVQLGASDGFEVWPSGSPRTVTGPAANNSIFNNVMMPGRPVATKRVQGAYTCPWLYNGLQRQVGMWFGSETSETGAGGTAILHTFVPTGNSIYFGNLAWTDTLTCHDVPLIKMQEVKFMCSGGELGQVVFTPYGRRELIDASGFNTIATMASVTLPTQPAIKYVQNSASQLTMLMNAASGSALAASDEFNLVGFELNFVRAFRERFDSSGLPYPSEPLCGTPLVISGSFSFSLVSDETGEFGTAEWLQVVDRTQMKATINLSGTSIGGSPQEYYGYKFYLPYIEFDTSGLWQFNTAGAPEITIPFTAVQEASAPSGFDYGRPYLEVLDTTSGLWLS